MSPQAARYGISGSRPRHGHSGRRRRRPALLIASVILLATLSLVGTFGGAARWQSPEAPASTPWESFGAPGHVHDVLLLTGARGISIAAGFQEGRQRTSLVVAPSTSSLAGRNHRSGAGLAVVVPRPAHLAVRGLFAERAPPLARA